MMYSNVRMEIVIYNNSNNYCQNLSSLQDELEADIRARWICPKVYAFHDLYKKYKIRLTDDVAFSDYILNLYRIMENGKYSIVVFKLINLSYK